LAADEPDWCRPVQGRNRTEPGRDRQQRSPGRCSEGASQYASQLSPHALAGFAIFSQNADAVSPPDSGGTAFFFSKLSAKKMGAVSAPTKFTLLVAVLCRPAQLHL